MSLRRRTTFYFLVGLIALAPIPLGSNRPFFWSLNGILIAVGTIGFLLASGKSEAMHVQLRALALPAALFGCSILWMFLQLVPVPDALLSRDPWDVAVTVSQHHSTSPLSLDPSATVLMIIRYMSYAAFFYLVVQQSARPSRARRFLCIIFWLVVSHAAYSLVALFVLDDTILLMPKWGYQGFATGFFVNRNSFATFVAFGLVIGTVLLMDALQLGKGVSSSEPPLHWDRELVTIGLLGTGLACILSALFLSGSRMGSASAAAGLSAVLAITYVRSPGRRSFVASIAVIFALLFAAIAMTSGEQLLDRIASVDIHLEDRLLLYSQVIDMIQTRPWTGHGGGTFPDAFPFYHRLPLNGDLTWDAAHNLYLELFADLGIFGAAPLASVFLLFMTALRKVWSAQDATSLTAGIALTVVAATHSTFDFSMQIQANVFLFLAVLGSAWAQAYGSRRKRICSPQRSGKAVA